MATANDVSQSFEEGFEIKSILGYGGFGVVFEVLRKLDKRRYAVKETRLPIRHKEREKILREVTALAQFEHPGIVKYFWSWHEAHPVCRQKQLDNKNGVESILWDEDSDSESSDYVTKDDQCHTLYMAMELCEKETLNDWLQKPDRHHQIVLNICRQLVESLDYVHSKGVMHRDLKPHNVFFSSEGKVKIGDFGLAKSLEDKKEERAKNSKRHTSNIGTYLYKAPEQGKGRDYDNKVDIFSMGLIFLELCLPPMITDQEKDKVFSQCKNGIFPDSLTGWKLQLIKKMTNKDPAWRPNTTEILQHLSEAEPPEFCFQLYYGVNKRIPVQNGDISEQGCKISRRCEDAIKTYVMPFETNHYMNSALDEKEKSTIKTIIESMDDGIEFSIENGNLFAKRCCKTQIFKTDGKSYSKKIERGQRELIFDSNDSAESSVYLTFAREIKIDETPFKRVVITMLIDCIAMKKEEANSSSTTSSLTPLISSSISLDNNR